MQLLLEPGKYVVAVSGGVDSMALLHLLTQQPSLELLVAHVDHGMRIDSLEDAALVAQTAEQYGLPFFSVRLQLGQGASEATARLRRYQFLEDLRQAQAALAIVTAHHQDDVLETAIINLSRGTGRRGLTALADRPDRRRPLLGWSKAELYAYATEHELVWREDTTNTDLRYLRNYVRHAVLPQFSTGQRQQLLTIIARLRVINTELDLLLSSALMDAVAVNLLPRRSIVTVPAAVAKELLTAWWRASGFMNYETKTVVRAYQAACRGRANSAVPLKKPYSMTIGRDHLALQKSER